MELRTDIKNSDLEQAITASIQQAGLTAAAWLRQAIEKQIAAEQAEQQQKRQKAIDDLMALREEIVKRNGGYFPKGTALQLLKEVREEFGERSVD